MIGAEEGQLPLDLVLSLAAESPRSLEELLGGNVGTTVDLTSGFRRPFYRRVCPWRAMHAVSRSEGQAEGLIWHPRLRNSACAVCQDYNICPLVKQSRWVANAEAACPRCRSITRLVAPTFSVKRKHARMSSKQRQFRLARDVLSKEHAAKHLVLQYRVERAARRTMYVARVCFAMSMLAAIHAIAYPLHLAWRDKASMMQLPSPTVTDAQRPTAATRPASPS